MTPCPVCEDREPQEFFSIGNLPLLLFPVDREVRYKIKAKGLTSYLCGRCRHIFVPPLSKGDSELIYGEYYRFYPYDDLETMSTVHRKPFEAFFERIVDSEQRGVGRSLLEVGCSSGTQLQFFGKFGIKSSGIDPSPLNEDDERLISGFYQDYHFDTPFDMVVARFVLEHVNDIRGFLKKIHDDLRDEGICFIQVPNIQTYIETFIPSFLAHEHVQYFNGSSLELAAQQHGFDILDVRSTHTQSILMALKRSSDQKKTQANRSCIPQKKIYDDFLTRRKRYGEHVTKVLTAAHGEVCFYGAGLMLAWLLYDLELLNEKSSGLVIDDNPVLEGKYLPLSNYQIRRFTPEAVDQYGTVLLTLNPVYHPQVVRKLEAARYRGEVYSLSQTGLQKVLPRTR